MMVYSFALFIPRALNFDLSTLDLRSKESVKEQVVPQIGVLFKSGCSENDFIRVQNSDRMFVVSTGKSYRSHSFPACFLEAVGSHAIDEAVSREPGQYSAVLFDKKVRSLTLIGDPGGVRSLFYIPSRNGTFVASNLGIFRHLLGKDIVARDVQSEAFLLRYAYLPPGKTVYRRVRELPPGQLLNIEVNTGNLEDTRPIRLCDTDIATPGEPCDALYELMLSVCKQQLGSMKRVGVLLGGFDSALVASLLARLEVDVETFSFSYEQGEFNQPFADELATYHGFKHHWVEIDSNIIGTGMSTYSESCNSPTLWPNYVIQTQYLCQQMVKEKIQGCFSGDGCDTAFMGYPSTYRRGGIYQRIPKLPQFLVTTVISLLGKSGAEYLFGHIFRVMISLLRASAYRVESRPLRSFQIFDPVSYERLIGQPYPDQTIMDGIIQELDTKVSAFTYPRKMYYGKSLFSPNRNKLVGSSDVAGFVIDSPYLHPHVKAFAQHLPDEVLRPTDANRSKEGKVLLMEMAEKYQLLPQHIIYQPKLAAIKSPIDSWFDSELRTSMLDLMEALPFPTNKRYTKSLLTDQWAERIYKKYFSDDMVVSLAASLLATYASYFKSTNF